MSGKWMVRGLYVNVVVEVRSWIKSTLCSCMCCSVETVSMKTFYTFHGSSFRKQRQDAIDVSQYPRWYVYPWSLTAYGAAPWLGKNTPFLTSSCWLTL